MRRRQIEQARQAAAENAAVSVSRVRDFQVLGTAAADPKPGRVRWTGIADVAEWPKGVCPHCSKHIGRGLHFHERACKG